MTVLVTIKVATKPLGTNMTTEQFAYWLQGFAELNSAVPTQQQWDSIRQHLATVFVKITPPVVTAPGFGQMVVPPFTLTC